LNLSSDNLINVGIIYNLLIKFQRSGVIVLFPYQDSMPFVFNLTILRTYPITPAFQLDIHL